MPLSWLHAHTDEKLADVNRHSSSQGDCQSSFSAHSASRNPLVSLSLSLSLLLSLSSSLSGPWQMGSGAWQGLFRETEQKREKRRSTPEAQRHLNDQNSLCPALSTGALTQPTVPPLPFSLSTLQYLSSPHSLSLHLSLSTPPPPCLPLQQCIQGPLFMMMVMKREPEQGLCPSAISWPRWPLWRCHARPWEQSALPCFITHNSGTYRKEKGIHERERERERKRKSGDWEQSLILYPGRGLREGRPCFQTLRWPMPAMAGPAWEPSHNEGARGLCSRYQPLPGL